MFGHLLIHSFLFHQEVERSIRKENPMNVVNRSLLSCSGHFQVTTIKPVPPGGLYGGLAMRCKINNNKQTKRK